LPCGWHFVKEVHPLACILTPDVHESGTLSPVSQTTAFKHTFLPSSRWATGRLWSRFADVSGLSPKSYLGLDDLRQTVERLYLDADDPHQECDTFSAGRVALCVAGRHSAG
jgi:hypothetical protein